MEEKVVVKKPPKSPALAGILSIFFPGTGAIYNQQIYKGFIFIIIIAALITMQQYGRAQPFIAILLGGFYIYQIIDSIQTAKSINRRSLLEEEKEEEPEEIPQFVKTGSVFWGVVLLGLGGILLLANFDVISYDTVWDFWPLVVIVIGLKLVVDYLSRKNNKN